MSCVVWIFHDLTNFLILLKTIDNKKVYETSALVWEVNFIANVQVCKSKIEETKIRAKVRATLKFWLASKHLRCQAFWMDIWTIIIWSYERQ